jgi:hypothetical protein
VLLLAVFLVNLPFVHQALIDREIARSGKDVEASVVDSRRSGDSYLVDYRLPHSSDPEQTRFSARVDRATYERARETDALLVRVVPGKPADNAPEGAVRSHAFTVVALIGDLVLLLVGVLGYRRWRQRSQHVVIDVDGDDVTLESARGRVTAACPEGWAHGLRPGQRVGGTLHLVTEHEVVPGDVVGGLEQLSGPSYVVRGRVLDAQAGRLVLELEDRSRLRVETAQRIRADIRDPTEVYGTLCFTPTGFAHTGRGR